MKHNHFGPRLHVKGRLHRWARIAAGLSVLGASAAGQTTVNLKTQTRNMDFSSAAATKPFKTGGLLPATCSAGEAFLLDAPPAAPGLFLCGPTAVWTAIGGLNSVSCATGLIQGGTTTDPVCSIDGSQTPFKFLLASAGSESMSIAGARRSDLAQDSAGKLWVCLSDMGDSWMRILSARGVEAADIASGTLSPARGGTGQTAATMDAALIGNGTAYAAKVLPDCSAANQRLQWNGVTHAWVCGSDPSSQNTTMVGYAVNQNSVTMNGTELDLGGVTVPGGRMGPGECLEISAGFQKSGTAAGATYSIYYGGASVTPAANSASAFLFSTRVLVSNNAGSSTAQSMWIAGAQSGTSGLSPTAPSAKAVNSAADQIVKVTALGSGPDSIVLKWLLVEKK